MGNASCRLERVDPRILYMKAKDPELRWVCERVGLFKLGGFTDRVEVGCWSGGGCAPHVIDYVHATSAAHGRNVPKSTPQCRVCN